MTTKPHKKFRRPQQPQPSEPETPKSIKKQPDKGIFSDGKWWCNCDPRQELSELMVKKKSRNKGRVFYKCDGCYLFLWADEAVARETGLTPSMVESKEVAEPQQLKAPPSFTQSALTAYGYQRTPAQRQSNVDTSFTDDSDRHDNGPKSEAEPDSTLSPSLARAAAPPAASLRTPNLSSHKRRREAFENDFTDIESDQEREMIKSVEKVEKRYTTPVNARPTDIVNGLPTPSVARNLFPQSKRQKHVSFEESSPSSSASVAPPSTPVAASSWPQSSPPSTPENGNYDVTNEVMQLLRGQNINPGVLSRVNGALTLAARRAKGFAMGSETARAAIKTRNEKIAALEKQISALEEREQVHRNQITNIKAGLMKMYEDN